MNESYSLEAPPERKAARPPFHKVVLDEFAFDSATLRPRHLQQLQQLATQIARSHQEGNAPVTRVVVVGHTDKRGANNYNWGLGFRRAVAVADHLRRLLEQRYNRVLRAPLSLRVETEGEHTPVPGSDAKNRRVEIHLLARKGQRGGPPGGASPAQSAREFEAGDEAEFEFEFEQGEDEHGDGEFEFESDEFESSEGEGEAEFSWEAETGGGGAFVRNFSGPNAECVTALARAGKTRAQALALINSQIGSAIRMLRVADARLKRGSRSSQTNALFRRIFRVPPNFVPKWLKQTSTIKDRGDVVAARCQRVADLLASGRIRYFCTINSTNCPDCGNDNSDFACSSWGREGAAPANSNVVCLGQAFWDDMKRGDRASTLSTLMHEPFHIYFGRYVTEHARAGGESVGKFGGINCIVQFVFQINGQTPPARVSRRCQGTPVRNEVGAF